jgi:hypothetical protein
MPAERIAMRQVRDVLRLKAAGVSGNEIARRAGVAVPKQPRVSWAGRGSLAGASGPTAVRAKEMPRRSGARLRSRVIRNSLARP